jgi:two-component system, LytTR family, response regulator
VSQVRMLLVHDDNQLSSRIAEYSEIAANAECKVVSSGREAIETFNSWLPSLLVVDVHIHDGNAFDLLDQLGSTATPVVITSESYSSDIQKSASDRGAVAYVVASEEQDKIDRLIEVVKAVAVGKSLLH